MQNIPFDYVYKSNSNKNKVLADFANICITSHGYTYISIDIYRCLYILYNDKIRLFLTYFFYKIT